MSDGRGLRTPRAEMSVPGRMARALAVALGDRGIASQVMEYEGIALVGLWPVDMQVWCERSGLEWRFRWVVEVTDGGKRVYTACPGSAVETAARRIARRCEALRAFAERVAGRG